MSSRPEKFDNPIRIAESWEETFSRAKRELRTKEDEDEGETEEFLYESEPVKTYRLVYDPQAESLRLDDLANGRGLCDAEVADSIVELVSAAKHILALQDNWDEEGSIGYTESTWTRATDFVSNLAVGYWNTHHSRFIPPRILPGPEGSIDIHWKAAGREVLINIPANDAIPAGYYGSGDAKESIKGKLDTSKSNLWILTWLFQ
jgi:hypothetical protein